jgi:hypothetical protein
MTKWLLLEMMEETGVTVWLDSWISGIIGKSGQSVEGVLFETKGGRKAIRAKVVIDATADGDAAVHTGCTRKEKPVQRHSLGCWVSGIDKARFHEFKTARKDKWEELKEVRYDGICHLAGCNAEQDSNPFSPSDVEGIWTHARGDATDAATLSAMQADCRRRAYHFLDHLKSTVPGWEKAHISHTSAQFGVRQGLTGVGQYTLTINDLKNGVRHPDDVAAVRWWHPRHPYAIPWRCMVPREVAGLIFSSRLIDCDKAAHGTLRLFAACFNVAHAAGAGAAVAVQQGISPHQLDAEPIIQLLREQDAWLPSLEEIPPPAEVKNAAEEAVGEH